MKIDEQSIIDYAITRLPQIEKETKDIAIVYVHEYIGEIALYEKLPTSADGRIIDLGIVNGKNLYVDNKPKEYYYYVVFRKMETSEGYEWDFVGMDKREIFKLGPSMVEQFNAIDT